MKNYQTKRITQKNQKSNDLFSKCNNDWGSDKVLFFWTENFFFLLFIYLQQMIIYETNKPTEASIDNHNMIKKIKLIKFGDFPSNQSINQQIKDQSNHSIHSVFN